MNNKIEKILSVPKSFWVSLHFFRLKDALKFADTYGKKIKILVNKRIKLCSKKGTSCLMWQKV